MAKYGYFQQSAVRAIHRNNMALGTLRQRIAWLHILPNGSRVDKLVFSGGEFNPWKTSRVG